MEENKNVSAEELAAEQAALQESKEDEVRSKIIAEFGFDEVDDIERIDKLVAKELEHSKKMSQAIGQKIKWRTEATKSKETPAPTEVKKDNVSPSLDIDKALDERFEKRDLESMEYSDEIKSEITKIAKAQGISVKQAARDPYILFKIKEFEKENDVEEASITRNNKPSGKKQVSIDNPPDVDMSTPEGRKTWSEYTEALKKQGY